MKQWQHALPFAVVAAMCLLALADMPYGYYRFLRLAVTGVAIWGSWSLGLPKSVLAWGWVAVVLLFNPIFPVYLDRGAWAPIDVVVATWGAVTAVFVAARRPSEGAIE